MPNNVPAVQFVNVTKTFGTTIANDRISMDVYKGEILALLGENGSGKTTLMNMLAGIYYPDSGHILVNGKDAAIKSPHDAYQHGIGMVHQHFKLIDVLTAAENIELGREGKLDLKSTSARIHEICDKYGFVVDPNKKIYNMSVSEKQTVEIVKVLFRGADILILDEPTAVLTPQETDKLFAVIRNMRADGKSVIIITHKLHEVEAVSDRVAVLRKGKYIGQMETAKTNAAEMTDMMVGHSVSLNIERPQPVNPTDRIIIQNLNIRGEDNIMKLQDVSFSIRSGEILGIAGISGCGQKELLEAIAGLQSVESGSIKYINDEGSSEELIGKNAKAINDMGVALSFVPEDRLGMGLVGSMNLAANMMLRSFRRGKGVFTDRKYPYNLAQTVIDELEVVTPDILTPVSKLSGGNVQKILVGREIAADPKVLLTAYAVRGLDINSSYTIYNLLNQQKKKGVAVVYVGEDLDVLLELCDRILVLCDGKVSGVVDGRTADKAAIGMMMTNVEGGNQHD